ncbi:hypothetical protein BT96DRAFT_1043300, partial [Gymnopus androsaceus JB14]
MCTSTSISSLHSPNILAVIPVMDAIDEAFASRMVDNHKLCAPLRHALTIGKKTLNKYYALTDNSDIYHIAMVLHPSLKLSYFNHLNWPEGWIDDAMNVTRNAWT